MFPSGEGLVGNRVTAQCTKPEVEQGRIRATDPRGDRSEIANHRGRQGSMSAIPMAITAQDVAKRLSMFEIDESLEALVEAAEQEAEANNGEISEDIKTALATYAEAFGYKVDRIANYLKAQKAEAELAQREADRFQARYKAAESREKRLKQMLV